MELKAVTVAVLALFVTCADNPTGSSGGNGGGTGGTGSAPPGMVYLAGGSFIMGDDDGASNAAPRHSVFLSGFSMDTTEVTQGEYAELMAATYSTYTTPNWYSTYGLGDTFPAYAVNWYDAVLFCNARSKRDGMDTVYYWEGLYGYAGDDCSLDSVSADFSRNGYRLPTEAEWEYAARAGVQTDYPWGDQFVDVSANQYVWYAGNTSYCRPVATKLPNGFGLYDMLGNVHEWCHDWYGYSYYQTSINVNPAGPATGSYRVYRGGDYSSSSSYLNLSYRSYDSPQDEYYAYGFRCVQRGTFTDPPTVTAMDDFTAGIYETVTLTATGSSETGTITAYYWALDGSAFADTTTVGTIQTTFTQLGTHTVQVKVRDSSGRTSVPDRITVTIAAAVPTNLSPANGAMAGINGTVLSWKPGSYRTSYQVLMDRNTAPSTVVSTSQTDTFYTVSATLAYNATYYWQIVARNASGDEARGNVWSFSTSGPPPELKNIAGGSFQMGSSDGASNEQPVHTVTVTSFLMDSTEVTQAEYVPLMGVNPSRFSGADSLPVDNLTWYDAVLFCNARSKRDGYDTVYTYTGTPVGTVGAGCSGIPGISADFTKNGYRLPTEAEWEYACRAGASTAYSFGDSDTVLGSYAWYQANADNRPHPPALKPPNGNGLYDMHGNLFEWCHDWYQDSYYSTSPAVDPAGPDGGTQKVARGGSYVYPASVQRCALRLNGTPSDRNYNIGLRCVRRQ